MESIQPRQRQRSMSQTRRSSHVYKLGELSRSFWRGRNVLVDVGIIPASVHSDLKSMHAKLVTEIGNHREGIYVYKKKVTAFNMTPKLTARTSMLMKAQSTERKHNTNPEFNLKAQARSLNWVVCEFDEFVKYLEDHRKRKSKSRDSNTVLKVKPRAKHHLILSDPSGMYNPVIKEFSLDKDGRETYPRLNWDAPCGESPFTWQDRSIPVAAHRNRITARSKQGTTNAWKAEFCELCNTYYQGTEEAHMKSKTHQAEYLNPENYEELDVFLAKAKTILRQRQEKQQADQFLHLFKEDTERNQYIKFNTTKARSLTSSSPTRTPKKAKETIVKNQNNTKKNNNNVTTAGTQIETTAPVVKAHVSSPVKMRKEKKKCKVKTETIKTITTKTESITNNVNNEIKEEIITDNNNNETKTETMENKDIYNEIKTETIENNNIYNEIKTEAVEEKSEIKSEVITVKDDVIVDSVVVTSIDTTENVNNVIKTDKTKQEITISTPSEDKISEEILVYEKVYTRTKRVLRSAKKVEQQLDEQKSEEQQLDEQKSETSKEETPRRRSLRNVIYNDQVEPIALPESLNAMNTPIKRQSKKNLKEKSKSPKSKNTSTPSKKKTESTNTPSKNKNIEPEKRKLSVTTEKKSVKTASEKKTSKKKKPSTKTPVKKTLAKRRSVKETSVKKTPVKKTKIKQETTPVVRSVRLQRKRKSITKPETPSTVQEKVKDTPTRKSRRLVEAKSSELNNVVVKPIAVVVETPKKKTQSPLSKRKKRKMVDLPAFDVTELSLTSKPKSPKSSERAGKLIPVVLDGKVSKRKRKCVVKPIVETAKKSNTENIDESPFAFVLSSSSSEMSSSPVKSRKLV